MQVTMRKQTLTPDDIKGLDCRKCNKVTVCTLYRGLGTLINNNWIGDEVKPFKPENTAMICKYFVAEMKENL